MASGSEVQQYLESELNPFYYRGITVTSA
ncbi:DUF5797 family protein [Haloarcula sp. NS06]